MTRLERYSIRGLCYRSLERACHRLEEFGAAKRRIFLDKQNHISNISKTTAHLIRSNTRYQNIHEGCTAHVFGNGPSLGKVDISKISEGIKFATSGFWKHPDCSIINPDYYCFADPLFFVDNAATRAFFEGLSTKNISSTLIVPYTAVEFLKNLKILQNNEKIPIVFARSMSSLNRSTLSLARPIPQVINVVHLAVMSAMAMGAKKIVLYGVDHDWLSHRGEDKHFYKDRTLPGHSGTKPILSQRTYKEWMLIMLELWNDYEELQKYSLRHNIEIVVNSPGSFLDLFPHVSD